MQGNIPFDPHVDVYPAANVPEVRVAIEAAGREAQAAGQMVQSAGQLFAAGVNFKKRQVEADYQSDWIAGKAQYKTLAMQRDAELAQIPVTNAGDYEKKAADIKRRYTMQWDDWTKKNIRNQGHSYVQGQIGESFQEFEAESEYRVAEHKLRFDRELSKSNLDLALQTAIDSDDQAAIDENMSARIAQGFLTGAEAEAVKERAVKEKDEKWDADAMAVSEGLLAQGDIEGFKAEMQSLRIPTEKQKTEMIRSMESRSFYNSMGTQIQEGEEAGLEVLGVLEEKLQTKPELDQSHREILTGRINASRARIESGQVKTQAGFIKDSLNGVLDLPTFEAAAEMDNAEGLPPDEVEQTKAIITKNLQSYAAEEQYSLDVDSLPFTSLKNRLIAARYGKTPRGTVDKNKPANKTITTARMKDYAEFRQEIESAPLGDLAKAKLFEEYLFLRQTDLQKGKEDLAGLWNSRDLSEAEKSVRIQMQELYRQTLRGDIPADFAAKVEADDSLIRNFFVNNPKPTEQQLKDLLKEAKNPILQKQFRQSVRGETSAERIQPGAEVDGYRFKGGDPASANSWEPIQ